jgi:DHA1 family multidrug resistance protein-like MFS transporter
MKAGIRGLKHPVYASLVLSFASFGDAFLYPFLPQYADVMQVPVVWIGILLSINRFIRIVFGPVIIKLFARYGVRLVTIVAAMMAIASTVGYGLEWGLLSLLICRMVWGMAFAILRISTLAYAFEHAGTGISLGVSKSIQEAGPMLALWLGPMLLHYVSGPNTFLLLALVSTPSLMYAISLPALQYVPVWGIRPVFGIPSLFNQITFAVSFIVEGVLIIVIGSLLATNNEALTTGAITSLAAGYLAYRRICFILFSPVSGVIADRVGLIKVFNFSLLLIVTGLVMLLVGWTTTGLIVIFTFNSVNSTMAPGGASDRVADKIRAVAVNATWRDMGAAIGTLTGVILLTGNFLFETFIIATFILAVVLIIHFRNSQRH